MRKYKTWVIATVALCMGVNLAVSQQLTLDQQQTATHGIPKSQQPAQAPPSPQQQPTQTLQQPFGTQVQHPPAQVQSPQPPGTLPHHPQQHQPPVPLSAEQKGQIAQAIRRLRVPRQVGINFSLTLGSTIPGNILLQPISQELVAVLPQHKGFSFFVVEDQIIIVEPSNFQIVAMVPYLERQAHGPSAKPTPEPAPPDARPSPAERNHVVRKLRERTSQRSKRIRSYRYFEREPERGIVLADPYTPRGIDTIR